MVKTSIWVTNTQKTAAWLSVLQISLVIVKINKNCLTHCYMFWLRDTPPNFLVNFDSITLKIIHFCFVGVLKQSCQNFQELNWRRDREREREREREKLDKKITRSLVKTKTERGKMKLKWPRERKKERKKERKVGR